MRKTIAVFGLSILLLFGCSTKKSAIGEPDELIVVADSADWALVENEVRNTFAPEIRTPQPEPWYRIKVIAPGEFENYLPFKNILILSLLRKNSPSFHFIQRTFSEDIVHNMQNGEQTVALKHDPWRRQQLLMILTSPTYYQFSQVLENRGEELRGYFNDLFQQRQIKYLYQHYEQKKKEKYLASEYGWSFRVPRDWIFIHERPDSNFVWMGKNLPIQWLSVYWQPESGPVEVDSALTVRLRTMIGKDYYGDIQTDLTSITTERTRVDSLPAIRIRGLWSHAQEAKGGPFAGVAYFDPKSGRLYYLDGQVFAPDMKKVVYLRRLELIQSTFHTAASR